MVAHTQAPTVRGVTIARSTGSPRNYLGKLLLNCPAADWWNRAGPRRGFRLAKRGSDLPLDVIAAIEDVNRWTECAPDALPDATVHGAHAVDRAREAFSVPARYEHRQPVSHGSLPQDASFWSITAHHHERPEGEHRTRHHRTLLALVIVLLSPDARRAKQFIVVDRGRRSPLLPARKRLPTQGPRLPRDGRSFDLDWARRHVDISTLDGARAWRAAVVPVRCSACQLEALHRSRARWRHPAPQAGMVHMILNPEIDQKIPPRRHCSRNTSRRWPTSI
jgi:hypothetical protein